MNTIWSIDDALVSHAYSARLAYLLMQVLPKESPVIDFGCGLGMYIAYLRARGYKAVGIEGTEHINDFATINDILVRDLSKPLPDDMFPKLYGSSLSLEVGEHIDPQFENVFLDNLTKFCNGRIVLSWAIPGQGGHGHFNERNNEHIIARLKVRGFDINTERTDYIRSNMITDPLWWFRDTLMIFDKRNN